MSLIKTAKDYCVKMLLGTDMVPRELLELHDYFRIHGPIRFDYKQEGNIIVAVSTNFRLGSIVTSGRNQKELDENIKDAIVTSFDLPSAYEKEAKLHKQESKEHIYALA
jgi:hypothetical protein